MELMLQTGIKTYQLITLLKLLLETYHLIHMCHNHNIKIDFGLS